MAISAQLFSPVLLLYLAMVMVNGDYGWLVSPVLRLKEQHFFFSYDVPQQHKEQPCLYHFAVWMGCKYLVGNIGSQVKDDGYHYIAPRLEVKPVDDKGEGKQTDKEIERVLPTLCLYVALIIVLYKEKG